MPHHLPALHPRCDWERTWLSVPLCTGAASAVHLAFLLPGVNLGFRMPLLYFICHCHHQSLLLVPLRFSCSATTGPRTRSSIVMHAFDSPTSATFRSQGLHLSGPVPFAARDAFQPGGLSLPSPTLHGCSSSSLFQGSVPFTLLSKIFGPLHSKRAPPLCSIGPHPRALYGRQGNRLSLALTSQSRHSQGLPLTPAGPLATKGSIAMPDLVPLSGAMPRRCT